MGRPSGRKFSSSSGFRGRLARRDDAALSRRSCCCSRARARGRSARRRRATRARTARRTRRCGARARAGRGASRPPCSGMPLGGAARAPPGGTARRPGSRAPLRRRVRAGVARARRGARRRAAPCGGADVYCAGGGRRAGRRSRPGTTRRPRTARARRAREAPCAAGRYCAGARRARVPGGVYGAAPRLTSAACSGACGEGLLLPVGLDLAARAVACGVDPTRFCPAGSASGARAAGPRRRARAASRRSPPASRPSGRRHRRVRDRRRRAPVPRRTHAVARSVLTRSARRARGCAGQSRASAAALRPFVAQGFSPSAVRKSDQVVCRSRRWTSTVPAGSVRDCRVLNHGVAGRALPGRFCAQDHPRPNGVVETATMRSSARRGITASRDEAAAPVRRRPLRRRDGPHVARVLGLLRAWVLLRPNEAETSPFGSGACPDNTRVYCPEGSRMPLPVPEGYYALPEGDASSTPPVTYRHGAALLPGEWCGRRAPPVRARDRTARDGG